MIAPEVVQSLATSEKGLAAAWAPASSAEGKVWLCWLRLVTVRVRVADGAGGGLMPKSSSRGVKTTASGEAVVARDRCSLSCGVGGLHGDGAGTSAGKGNVALPACRQGCRTDSCEGKAGGAEREAVAAVEPRLRRDDVGGVVDRERKGWRGGGAQLGKIARGAAALAAGAGSRCKDGVVDAGGQSVGWSIGERRIEGLGGVAGWRWWWGSSCLRRWAGRWRRW